jgi:superfamily II RNA helicase
VSLTLDELLPRDDEPTDNDFLLGRFLEYVASAALQLYPAQEAALLELYEERNVILNTPTGSGKSLVATALQFKALAQGKRSVYTCPIKALVNEKWLALCRQFGPENVGLSTGDASVNRDAPILCCTAEVLANIALRDGSRANVQEVIMDEFHYYADRERGGAWQIPLLTLPQARFLLMSATLGDTSFFEEELTRLNARPTVTVRSIERPVPLEYTYAETPLAQTLENLLTAGKGPVYAVHFTQAAAAESAQNFTSINVSSREEKTAIAQALEGFKFNSPYGPEIKRWLRHGIGVHHAGLLPKYRVLIEQLAQRGLLKVICGTDTLGVGINVPIRTVLFTRLCKYDGQKTAILSARDFHQIGGRAGRKGFDNIGYVVAQAPEHAIENLLLEQKGSGKKFVRRKPPEKGFVNWDKATFTRLIAAPPERLQAQLQVTHGMLLNVLGRTWEDGCRAMQSLIRRCHDSPKAKKAHFQRAWQLFRALVERKIVEFVPRNAEGVHLRLNVGLQQDFSMNQTLSLYVHDTLPLMDPQAPDYALVVLTLVESILEDPDIILRRQLDRIKTQAVAEMKMEGLDYNQRMEELEKLEYPKPNREFIYSTFNAFAERHPWVGQENIRPKSIAREMFEEFRSFADYIKIYELQRAEGLLLRHLTSVHKALTQTVPDSAKNEAVREMEMYFGALIRQVDSSLLEEWERMRDPNYRPNVDTQPEVRPPGWEEAARDITRDAQAFTMLIRNRIFTFLRALSGGDLEGALAALTPHPEPAAGEEEERWTTERLRRALDAYHADHRRICLDPAARNRRHTYVIPLEDDKRRWRVQQMLVDPDEANDWVAEFEVDLAQSRIDGEPALRLRRIEALAA